MSNVNVFVTNGDSPCYDVSLSRVMVLARDMKDKVKLARKVTS